MIPVVSPHSEIDRRRAVPLIIHLQDFEDPVTKSKALGALVRSVS